MSDISGSIEASTEASPAEGAPRPENAPGWIGRLVPTTLVLAALAGLAAWGHQTGWSLSSRAGSAAAKDDWCEAHGVPESICVECNKNLMPPERDFGWCKQHGVPNCPWEHPELAQVDGQPAVTALDRQRAERALAFASRIENNSKCKLEARRIQFASADAVEKAGIEVEAVDRAPIVEVVTANGELTYDPTRVARLSARVPGVVWRVTKQLGEHVKQGEVLALLDAAEVGRAKAEFLQTLAQVELRAKAFEGLRAAGGAVAERQIQESQTALREAQIRVATAEQTLVNLGLPVRADELRGLSAEEMTRRLQFLNLPRWVAEEPNARSTTGNLIPVSAPLEGTVVAREAVSGEVVDLSKTLFVIADTSRLWLMLHARLEDAKRVKPGQSVRFRNTADDTEVTGTVAWVSPAADERTRTVKVRADLANADGRLIANSFGTGRIILRQEEEAIVVPNQAVHWEGCCHVVFVRDKNFLKEGAPKIFHTRKVLPGATDENNTEIVAGVLPGELVATKGSGALRGELLKNNLGEG